VVWVRDSPAALRFDLAGVFPEGATMPSLHPVIFLFLVLSVVWDRDSPAAFCFDLARVFLQGSTMPPTPKIILELFDGDEIKYIFYLQIYTM